MLLLVDLLWIVIGTIYIVYKIQKDEHIFTKENIKFLLAIFGFILAPQIIVNLVCNEDNVEAARSIVLLMTIVAMIGFCIYGFFATPKPKQSKNDILAKQRIDGIQQEFNNAGYNVHKVFTIYGNKEDVATAIAREKYMIPLYDKKESRQATIREVYALLSAYQRKVLLGYKEDQLAELCGIPIEYVPLNQNISESDVRSRNLHRARERNATKESLQLAATTMITSCDIKEEAKCQRKELMVDRLLQSIGLAYPYEFTSEFPSDRNYIEMFNACFDKQAKMRALMEDAGYHLNDNFINRLAFDLSSPVNSIYVNTPAEELYDWLCKTRTEELAKMLWLKKAEFNKVLGVSLIEIPPPKGNTTQLRDLCAVKYCLAKEGLQIDEAFVRQKLFVYDNLNEFKEYESIFNSFVDNYISEHI